MRVLDLGAHDGFVSKYVAERFDGDVHVDGIELNSVAAEAATRRLSGTVKQGRAEDAPLLFRPGSYDAVVAFELIEHVPDVPAFLDACEAMLAPGGRVYISTPDGTFGNGNNPHHLRVYRSVDLAELLRRRGDVQAMTSGRDGLAVASYVPWRAMRGVVAHDMGEVAIYCGPGWKTWGALDPEMSGGLGGSETAAVRLAEELQRLGWTPTVYGEVEPGCVGQVVYRHHSQFDPMEPRRVVIASRAPQLVDRPINAERVVLWMHDTDYGQELSYERASKFDAIMVLSEWHQQWVDSRYGWTAYSVAQGGLAERVHIVPNGIVPDYFTTDETIDRFADRVIFSSSPDRGLDLLLEWWPEVREQEPNAELVYCYADVYQAVAGHRPEVAAHHERIRKLADQPGVRNLGALSQPDLAKVMRSCGVWVHPSWNSPSSQPFCETFCIGAVEATAAGCHPLVAPRGALPERVAAYGGDHAIVNESPGGFPAASRAAVWGGAIVQAIRAAREDGPVDPASALQVSWEAAAKRIEQVILG